VAFSSSMRLMRVDAASLSPNLAVMSFSVMRLMVLSSSGACPFLSSDMASSQFAALKAFRESALFKDLTSHILTVCQARKGQFFENRSGAHGWHRIVPSTRSFHSSHMISPRMGILPKSLIPWILKGLLPNMLLLAKPRRHPWVTLVPIPRWRISIETIVAIIAIVRWGRVVVVVASEADVLIGIMGPMGHSHRVDEGHCYLGRC
jgi:hypothetical protein